MSPARIILLLAAVYLAVGAAFATWFVTVGVGRLDPAARAGTRGFRVLIWPGSVALWPILRRATRRRRLASPPEERP